MRSCARVVPVRLLVFVERELQTISQVFSNRLKPQALHTDMNAMSCLEYAVKALKVGMNSYMCCCVIIVAARSKP